MVNRINTQIKSPSHIVMTKGEACLEIAQLTTQSSVERAGGVCLELVIELRPWHCAAHWYCVPYDPPPVPPQRVKIRCKIIYCSKAECHCSQNV